MSLFLRDLSFKTIEYFLQKIIQFFLRVTLYLFFNSGKEFREIPKECAFNCGGFDLILDN